MARICALVFLAAVGCRSVQQPINHETRASLASSGYVTLPNLAARLDLDYRGEENGTIELSAPPDHVFLVRDSTQARVNGSAISLDQPCMRRARDYVLATRDAELLASQLRRSRSARVPLPRIPEPGGPPPAERASGLPDSLRPARGVARADWRYIVIHHAAVQSGDAAFIHRLHLDKGWDGLGYHFVIGNGTRSGDGQIEVGFRWKQQSHGAHARATPNDDNRWNLHGIGICLVGDFTAGRPSQRQMDALVTLVRNLMREYDIPARSVVPHSGVSATVCPGPRFPWDEFKARLR